MSENGHGTRRVCTVCINDYTVQCKGCTWPRSLRRPTEYKKNPHSKLPKGNLREVVQ